MQLPHEQRIYQILRGSTSLGHSVGFPQMLFYGESPTMNILVMQLLGSTLEDVFNYCNKKFSLKTIIMIFDQLISRIGIGFFKSTTILDKHPRTAELVRDFGQFSFQTDRFPGIPD